MSRTFKQQDRRSTRDPRDSPDTCILCDCDLGHADGPACEDCMDGFEGTCSVEDFGWGVRRGRFPHSDDYGAIEREGWLEDAVRALEDMR